MAPDPVHLTLMMGADNILYWKGTWSLGRGDNLGYWGALKTALDTRVAIVDQVSINLLTTDAEGYYLFFYQGDTATGALQGPSGTSAAGVSKFDTYHGAWGPMQVDANTVGYAVGVYPIDGAWTIGDVFTVYLSGRGLPTLPTVAQPKPQPVDLRKISFWRN